MRALAGLLTVLAACSFDTAVTSESSSPGDGGALDARLVTDDSGILDASLTHDGSIQGDASQPPILYVLSPTGDVSIEADFGGNVVGDFDEDCPDGRVVTGFDGDDTSNGICRLLAFCSRLTANPDGTVTTSDPQPTNLHGNSGSFFVEDPLQCPENQVVVGASGRANNTVRVFEITCAPLTWENATTTYSIGTPAQLPGNIGSNGGQQSSGSCGPGKVSGGFGGNAGTLIDRFELHCFDLEATAQ